MIEFFEKFLFTIPIQVLVTIFFVVICCIHFKKLAGLRVLMLYAILSICQSAFGIYISVYTNHTEDEIKWVHNSINVFMLLEFIIFSNFILQSLKGKITKILMMAIIVFFISFTFYNWSATDSFDKLPSFLSLIESYLMILGCFFYYFELFYFPAEIVLGKNYRFWIVTGMLSLFAFFIPLFLQRRNVYQGHLEIYNAIYLMTFIGYIILFTCFAIGLKWKIKN